MATLTNTKIKDTYDGLLKTTDNDVIGASEKVITDGLGNASVLSIGTGSASFSGDVDVNSNSLQLTGATNPQILVTDTTNSVSVGLQALDASTKIDSTHSFKIEIGNDIIQSVTSSGVEITGTLSSTEDATINGLTIGKGNGSASTNTALGYSTLNSNTTGAANTAVGYAALLDNTTGTNNVAVGLNALRYNTEGERNVAVGSAALEDNTDGDFNVAVGIDALNSNTTGNSNVAIGYYALRNNTASNNTAVGYQSMTTNTTGAYNTAIGIAALYENTEGQNNTAVGYNSANSNTTGLYNTALGSAALYANETSGNNTALGYFALRNNTAANNTAVGSGALADNTTGGVNTAVGKDALNSNTTGGGNTAIGYQALQVQTAQSSNTAIGHLALKNNVAPSNTAVGSQALTANTTGQNNTAIGKSALLSNVDGIWNTALGYGAGYNKTGGNSNIYIGYQAIGGAVDSTNEIVIGKGATGNGSNTATYGNSSITHHYFEGDIVLTDGSNPVLSVQDTLGGSSFLKLLAGDTGTSNIYLGDDSDENAGAIVYDHSDNSMSFRTNGFLEKMSIDSSGNVSMVNDLSVTGNLAVDTDTLYVDAANNRVGIGTSSPDATFSAVTSSANSSAAKIGGLEYGGTQRGLTIKTFQSGGGDDCGVEFNAAEGLAGYGSFVFKADTSERMRIDSGGRVGINESNPDTPLKVVGNGNSDVDVLTIGNFEQDDSGDETANIKFELTRSYTNTLNPAGYIKVGKERAWSSSGGRQSFMSFYTRNGTSDPAEAMRIDSSGTVSFAASSSLSAAVASIGHLSSNGYMYIKGGTGGLILGDDSTASRIQIEDNSNIRFETAGEEAMRIDSSGNVGIGMSPSDKVQIKMSNTAELSFLEAGTSSTAIKSSGSLVFEANPSNNFIFQDSGSERMRITSGGDVLIGTQGLPDGTTYYGSGFRADSNSRRTLRMATSFTGLQDLIEFYNPNGYIGKIQTNGSATIYATSSDYRLKENVIEMTGALDRVDALKPSRFNFIADPEKTVDGFLAHEVAEVIPEAVTGEKDAVEEYEVTPAVLDEDGNVIEEAVMGTRPVYQGIDQSKIVPLLVGAIKELRAEIELLKAK